MGCSKLVSWVWDSEGCSSLKQPVGQQETPLGGKLLKFYHIRLRDSDIHTKKCPQETQRPNGLKMMRETDFKCHRKKET